MVFLINLFGAAALLLWGLRMVRTGVMRAFGSHLRAFLGSVMGNRFSALFGGLGATILLQSSSATALITSSFASRKVVGAGAALAIMLGADIGTSLVAQAYAFRVTWISPVLILIGYIMFNHMADTRTRDLGRAIVGLGITLLGLGMITLAAEPIREAPVVPLILRLMENTPVSGVIVGAVLTIASTSSLAIVLLIVSFATHDLIPVEVCYSLVLGANLGSAVMPIIATMSNVPEARRVPVGNLIFRVAGVVIALPLLPFIMPEIASLQPEAWRQVLNFHVAFNLGLAILFIWLIGPVSRLTAKLLPEQERPDDPGKARYLTEGAVENPSIGLANASREALRMGDLLGQMLDLSLQVFKQDDRRLVDVCSDVDSQIDRLNEAIKLYLTRVSRDVMDSGDHKKIIDLITFTTNLEHAADIVDKSLMDLAAKKTKYGLKFSAEGAKEIEDIHRRLNANVQLAMNVFMTGDLTLARQLFAEKQVFRVLEKTASENHLLRLREGRIESISTSGLHLDILRDLKRINSHLALVAQPRLEAAGELHPSRLKEEAHA
ncbi:Na/Pi cotransporter family protein [Dongia deserti]|uniref:Na/Pi cotransporter family protein n=1 Tax=Dongia deserti TaxID=2268030 RepID=UPI000E650388|nr:Na/Pi cotransporter family protein [Dongia deserti]